MSAARSLRNATYYVTAKVALGRPDTKVEGVFGINYDDGVLILRAEDGAVLFLAPLTEVVYVKAVEGGGRGE